MNKRFILNIMIVAILTFYLIFSIVYKRVVNHQDTEQIVVQNIESDDVWQQPMLVSKPWNLTRLEIYSAQDKVILDKNAKPSAQKTILLNSWQMLSALAVDKNNNLPMVGMTVLAFIEEDSQPLVFRVNITDEALLFYRMIDKKQFSFPTTSIVNFFPESIVKSFQRQ